MKYLPLVGMKYCLRQHEIPLRAMKYLPTEGMKEALQSNAIQIWLLLEEKLAAKPTDEVSRWAHLNFIRFVSAAQHLPAEG